MDESGGGGGRRTLASELARVQTIVRELEANMDQQDLPAAAMEICGELASRVDRSLRIVRSWVPGSASDWSTRGDGDTAGTGDAATDAQFKRRKGKPSVQRQVRVASVHDTAALDDGFSWRKYGQKEILGAKYPRSYFRCTYRSTQNCPATKQVQRTEGDPLVFDVVYHGAHSCVQAAQRSADQQHLPPGLAGQEQTSPRAPETGGGLHAGFEPMTPFFSSAPTGADFGGLSPMSLEWQLRSGYGAGMEVERLLEEFFSNPCDSFQWDYQDLYAAN